MSKVQQKIQNNFLEEAGEVPPRRFAVFMHNDDYTTQDFVVHILMKLFGHNASKAESLMLQIHTKGKAKVGVYTKDVAESKCHMAMQYARAHQMPLMLSFDYDDGD